MATYSTACPHCRHDRSLFHSEWAGTFHPNPDYWHTYFRCGHCHMGIGALLIHSGAGRGATPINLGGDVEKSYVVMQSWPEPTAIVAPRHVPDPVARRFIEAEDSFARQKWNSAVAVYRSTLDIATKDLEPAKKGETFYKRLEWMKDNGKITTNIWDWASHVRVDGNLALHEPEEFAEEDATPLRYFTEMFLRYVYELPGEVERMREDKGGA